MYTFLLVVLALSVLLFLTEAAYVLTNLTTKMHAYLLIYLTGCTVNNVGYIMEITARTSEAAYISTKLLYLGKMIIAFSLLIFVLRFCRVRFPKWFPLSVFVLHTAIYAMVITNDIHHLYYSSITFVRDGLFPHNVYGHGPVYYVYLVLPFLYCGYAIVLLSRKYKVLKTDEERKQIVFLMVAPITALVGTLIFFTGKTGGFDTSNLGLILSSIFMLLSLFKYKLIDTVDMVKNTVADSLDDGLIAVDEYGTMAYINTKAHELMPDLDIVGKGASEALVSDLESRSIAKDKINVDGKVYQIRAQDMYQGGIFRGRLYVLDDVTDTILYTKQIEDERDRADVANAAKSNFLSNMSHEIRTPMNAVVGMTDIMLRNNPKEEDITYLESIKRSGNALLDIINDILDFSKIESGKMEIINDDYEPLPLLNDLKMIFSTRIGEKPIRMIYEIDEKLPAKLKGDAVRIRQVLINIVNNAIKFTDVGYIRLKLKVEFKNPENVILNVSIQDSGQGIKDEELGKLFQSFTQVDAQKNHAKEGTGLGLAITKQLLDLMGGSIGVESVYGRGTEFFFTIPQEVIDKTPAKDVVYKHSDEEVMNFTAPKAEILLVEDNEINVKVAKGLLEPLKFNMDVAQNGLTSLKMVSEKQYDIIFMDHMMPVMDGVEATQRIREFEGEYFKRVPIIALTANAISGAKEEFLESGMNDFVSKPINMKEICKVLRKWLPQNLIEENESAVAVEAEAGVKSKPEAESGVEVKSKPEAESGLEVESKPEVESEVGIESKLEVEAEAEVKSKPGVMALESVEMVTDTDTASKSNPLSEVNNKEGEGSINMAMGALDRSIGIEYCGTEELYEAVLEDFYRLIDTKAEKIEQLLRDNDIRNYTIEVHALKSTARMIGATEMSELAFKMEQAGNANDMDAINSNTPILMDMYRSYKETLAYFDGNASDDDKEEVSVSTIKSELFKMNLAVKDFDMDLVDEAMANLNRYKMPNDEAKALISQLDTLVRDVSFDGIPEVAAKLMKAL